MLQQQPYRLCNKFIMKKLNIICCTFFHQFNLALTVRNYYSALLEPSILMISESMVGLAASYKLKRGDDYVASPDEIRINDRVDINFVVHHYKRQIEPLNLILDRLQSKINSLGVSFFADGYLNNFLTHQEFSEFLLGRPELKRYDLISFGVKMDGKAHAEFRDVVIPSETFICSVASYKLLENVNTRLKEIDKLIDKADLALVAFRPWETRIKGAVAPYDGDRIYHKLMLDFIAQETSNVSHIMFHGDNRARNESDLFFEQLKNGIKHKLIINSTDILPGDVNMDVILFIVSRLWSNTTLRVFGFDSTLCLPFVDAGHRGDYVMGVTGKVLETYPGLDALNQQLKRRYKYLEEFVGLSTRAYVTENEESRYIVLRGK